MPGQVGTNARVTSPAAITTVLVITKILRRPVRSLKMPPMNTVTSSAPAATMLAMNTPPAGSATPTRSRRKKSR